MPTLETAPRSLSRGKTIGFSAFAAIGLFLGVELALRLLGVAPVSDRTRTWFPDHILNPPLLHETVAENSRIPSLRAGQAHHFHPVEPNRPDDAFRVIVFGGSAAHGYGVLEPAAFPHRLEQLLQKALPSLHVQVINLGTVAWSSQQILWAARQIWDFGPIDLVILYSGHNELLELSSWKTYLSPGKHRRHTRALLWRQRLHGLRIFALLDRLLNPGVSAPEGRDPRPPGLAAQDPQDDQGDNRPNLEAGRDPVGLSPARRLDDLVAVPEEERARMGRLERNYGAATYRHNIGLVLEMAKERGVPVIVANPAPNDFHDPAWFRKPGKKGEKFAALMAKVQSAGDVGDHEEVVSLSREALQLFEDPSAWFALGNALLSQGRDDEGRKALAQARETAEYPNRVLPSVSEAILKFNGREGVLAVVDVEAHFRAMDDRGLIGYDLVYDHCHPSVQGSVEIAGLIAKTLLDSKHPRLSSAKNIDITKWIRNTRNRLSKVQAADPRIWEWDGRFYDENPPRYISDFQGEWQEVRDAQEAKIQEETATAMDWLWAGNGRFLDYRIDPAFEAWNRALELDPALCLADANAAQSLLWLGQRKAAKERAKRGLECNPVDKDLLDLSALIQGLEANRAQAG